MPYTILTAVFLVFLGLFWLVPLHIRLSYRRFDANDHFIVDTTALGKIVRYRLEIPVTELTQRRNGLPWVGVKVKSRGGAHETRALDEQKKGWMWLRFTMHNYDEVREKVERLLVVADDYADFMRWITNKTRIERLYWVTCIGLEDAADTAIAVGGCWAIKSYVVTKLWHRHCCTRTRPFVRVTPAYNQEVFHTDFECIFSVRLGHIIGAGIRLLRYKI